MLRRPATTITLTPDDILEYDESVSTAPSLPADPKGAPAIFKEPLLSRNERLGIDKKEK